MTKYCEVCGAQNSAGMRQCGSCGGPLREDISEIDSQGHSPRPTEGLWTAVSSTEDAAKPTRGRGINEFALASKVLIAALMIFVLSFALQAYVGEKTENLYDAVTSGDYLQLEATMDEYETLISYAKWAGYLQTTGLIVLAAGLAGIAIGLSNRLA